MAATVIPTILSTTHIFITQTILFLRLQAQRRWHPTAPSVTRQMRGTSTTHDNHQPLTPRRLDITHTPSVIQQRSYLPRAALHMPILRTSNNTSPVGAVQQATWIPPSRWTWQVSRPSNPFCACCRKKFKYRILFSSCNHKPCLRSHQGSSEYFLPIIIKIDLKK